jgi:hypothetical protein
MLIFDWFRTNALIGSRAHFLVMMTPWFSKLILIFIFTAGATRASN